MVFIMATLIIMAMIYASSPVVKTQERIRLPVLFLTHR